MNYQETIKAALAVVQGERNDQYGSFEDMMERTALVWSGVLNTPVTGEQVALCMVGLKLVRADSGPQVEDSFVDGVGYFAMASQIVDTKTKQGEKVARRIGLGYDNVTTEAINDR